MTDTNIFMTYIVELVGLGLFAVLVFAVLMLHNIISKSFGYNYLKTIVQTRLMANKGFILLEIIHLSGAVEYRSVKISPFIEYTIKENKKEVTKGVFYDEKSLKHINSIPLLSCNPNDVRPLSRFNGIQVRISPEMINKGLNDLTTDPEIKDKQEKLFKTSLYAGAILLIAVILLTSYMYGELTSLNTLYLACERELARTATIVPN